MLARRGRWRLLRQGPTFIRVGAASVRYRPADLAAFIERCPTFSDRRSGETR